MSAGRYPALPYVAPFAVFIGFLALEQFVHASIAVMYPIRLFVVLGVILGFSRGVVDFRVKRVWASTLLGVAVFVAWVAPDALWHGYRSHWLFTNAITGEVRSGIPEGVRASWSFVLFRAAGCFLLVPVVEELFWRGWLARWLIDGEDFRRVKMGAYSAVSFWVGSALFASEHGPFWEVGLIAGVAYNWWMCRTKSLGDCIFVHAVTNACLSVYVLMSGKWEYWL
jgi:CAAX prenyl protease-like protein